MSARLTVLISGNGSNLQAILDACSGGALAARVVRVVSNRRRAYGLQRAEQAGVDTAYLPLARHRKQGLSRAQYDADLAELVLKDQPDLVVLAGWMHVLSPDFLKHFPGKVINLHPALPGQFPGVDAIERAFDAFQAGQLTHTGIMVHHVVPEIDAGPVVATAELPISSDDTLSELTARVHAAEHQLLVHAIDQLIRGLGPDLE